MHLANKLIKEDELFEHSIELGGMRESAHYVTEEAINNRVLIFLSFVLPDCQVIRLAHEGVPLFFSD